MIILEKKIISKESLANLFVKNEIEAASLLRDALMDVKNTTGSITDPDIKAYNSMDDAEFILNLSLTTIKNYAAKYGYAVFNVDGDTCVVKQFNVDSYKTIKMKLNSMDKNNEETIIENNNKNILTAEDRLALDFVRKGNEHKEQTAISIRCAKSVQSRLEQIYKKYSIFPKQYIISYLLDIGLTKLENIDGKTNK